MNPTSSRQSESELELLELPELPLLELEPELEELESESESESLLLLLLSLGATSCFWVMIILGAFLRCSRRSSLVTAPPGQRRAGRGKRSGPTSGMSGGRTGAVHAEAVEQRT